MGAATIAPAPGDGPPDLDGLITQYYRAIHRLAWRMTGNETDADDAVQEIFERIMRGLPGFRGEASMKTWVYRIAVNTLRRSHRRRRRREAHLTPVADPDGLPGGSGEAESRLLKRAVREAVGRLPDRQRLCVQLKVYDGLKYEEIAAVVGCTVGTAKANVHHALRKLQEVFA